YLCGDSLSFYDAAAPIVTAESLSIEDCFTASRYDKGGDDAYINCPMNKEEYEAFYEALVSAERAPVHDFDVANPKVYEGCMPIKFWLSAEKIHALRPVEAGWLNQSENRSSSLGCGTAAQGK
ncbi:MAG: FAD-dependent oxidoreductase, partial [Acutalibacteraceae bacterium]